MRQLVFVFSLLLILLIGSASYWFVCKTRCDCRNSPNPAAVAEKYNAPKLALAASVEEARKLISDAGVQKVYFETAFASTEQNLLPLSYLEKVKLFLNNSPEAKVMITGHTDSQGPGGYNQLLSSLRARFIKTWMVICGINPEQIVTEAKGYTEPAASNDTPEGREQNRRTEFYVLI